MSTSKKFELCDLRIAGFLIICNRFWVLGGFWTKVLIDTPNRCGECRVQYMEWQFCVKRLSLDYTS